MLDWLKKLVGGYHRWLKNETEVAEADDGWVVISTPFLGAFNDFIEIYVRREDGGILLSDDGETLRNLEAQGCDVLRNLERLKFAEAIVHDHGVRLNRESGELLVEAQASNFPQKKHELISAVLEINGMAAAVRLSVEGSFDYRSLDKLGELEKFANKWQITHSPIDFANIYGRKGIARIDPLALRGRDFPFNREGWELSVGGLPVLPWEMHYRRAILPALMSGRLADVGRPSPLENGNQDLRHSWGKASHMAAKSPMNDETFAKWGQKDKEALKSQQVA